jgi:hypothetical protein
MKLLITHPALLTILVLLAACSRSTTISVENRSSMALESVVIKGTGFSHALGQIAPGATATAEVEPTGESGLAISFLADGRSVDLPASGYLESGGQYKVKAAVTPELAATVEADLRTY